MNQSYEINLVNLIEKFNSEDRCRAYLEKLRWPDGVRCPRCESAKISRIHDRDQFDCDDCRYHFSVTSGTMMHDTHLPLWKWFLAVYMIVESKKSVSAAQLQRTLGIAYRSAWYLCHRIRGALKTPEALLAGIVEVDETWLGGKAKNKRGRKTKKRAGNKQIVAGAVERGGDVRLQPVPNVKRATLRQFIQEHIGPDAEYICTDDSASYDNIDHHGIPMPSVNHSKDEWVVGNVHTNTIEGTWSLFNRCVVGAYHKISVKHLDRYLDEFEFRFNNRENPYIFRDAMRMLVRGEHVTYAELVA